jgi:hypothetical protein
MKLTREDMDLFTELLNRVVYGNSCRDPECIVCKENRELKIKALRLRDRIRKEVEANAPAS